MRYACYNDFELLYLVREGSQQALDLLYQKYFVYVNKISYNYIRNSDKRNDLVQEGYLVVHKCILSYTDKAQIPLFWYIKISITRKFMQLVKSGDYYRSNYFNDTTLVYLLGEEKQFNKNYLRDGTNFFNDEMELIIYNKHLLDGASLIKICEKYNIKYSKAYSAKKRMLQRLKKMLTNYLD